MPNIAAVLIAFVSLIALVNGIIAGIGGALGIDGLTLQRILGWIFSPLMLLVGTPWAEAQTAGALFGEKLVLNEFVAVATRKLGMRLAEIREVLAATRALCTVEPLTIATHDLALDLSERLNLSFYDALIVAAAAAANCTVLYSEDMQDGQRIESLTIRNPFAGG